MTLAHERWVRRAGIALALACGLVGWALGARAGAGVSRLVAPLEKARNFGGVLGVVAAMASFRALWVLGGLAFTARDALRARRVARALARSSGDEVRAPDQFTTTG